MLGGVNHPLLRHVERFVKADWEQGCCVHDPPCYYYYHWKKNPKIECRLFLEKIGLFLKELRMSPL